MIKPYKFEGSGSSGANKWLLQRLSGIMLLILLIGHYVLMHATPDSGHTYQAVMERLKTPLWKVIDLSFVTLGLWHGLNGLWNIVRDYKMKPWLSITKYTLIITLGLIFWFLGINTILSF
jgi:succinate dehydrogenase / fumarate reductase, membrane anchor subunit